MQKDFTVGSICSGIEAATIAMQDLPWKSAWFSEVDSFPSAVLCHRVGATAPIYPLDPNEEGLSDKDKKNREKMLREIKGLPTEGIPNYGDMSLLPEKIANGEIEAPNILVGGCPCQAFSLAGLRKGLSDARGNLTMTYVQIVDAIDKQRMENGKQPGIALYENVPGLLSSKDNAFGNFIAALSGEDEAYEIEDGKWPKAGMVCGPRRRVAWALLDARHFGIPQRRKRIWVLAVPNPETQPGTPDLDPAEILAIGCSVLGDTKTSKRTKQENTDPVGESIGINDPQYFENHPNDSRVTGPHDIANAVTARYGTGGGNCPLVAQGCDVYNHAVSGDVAVTLTAHSGACNTAGPKVIETYRVGSYYSEGMLSTNPIAGIIPTDVSPTLDTTTPTPGKSQGGVCIVQDPVIAFTQCDAGRDATTDMAMTLRSGGSGGYPSHSVAYDDSTQLIVRRLTPVECERLMGFPDDWTLIPWRGKPLDKCPDDKRYKACGNSWATPVAKWIFHRIDRAISEI